MPDRIMVRGTTPHRERLAELLIVLTRETISLELGTFWAKPRNPAWSNKPVGCALGHYAWIVKPPGLRIVPLNFLEQLKAPISAGTVLAKYPNSHWQHHTLHYQSPEVEAWGLNAAMIYFQLRAWDCQRLFWPAGNNYKSEVTAGELAQRLRAFLRTSQAIEEDSP